jgi:hypothetical protein
MKKAWIPWIEWLTEDGLGHKPVKTLILVDVSPDFSAFELRYRGKKIRIVESELDRIVEWWSKKPKDWKKKLK